MSDVAEYNLKKHRAGCTGLFWRPDPTGKEPRPSNDNWPRDGATLRGTTVEHNGQKWLRSTEIKQAGSDQWLTTPTGTYMPFEYDNHYSLEKA